MLEIASGKTTRLATVSVGATSFRGSPSAASVFYVVAETGHGVRWAAVHDLPGGGTGGVAVRVIAPTASGELGTLDLPATGSYFYGPGISSDGRTLYIPQWMPVSPNGAGNIEVDLPSLTRRPGPPWGSSFLSVRRPGLAGGAPGIGFASAPGATLLSQDGAVTYATLATRGAGPRGTGICSAIAVSGDLRQAAAVVGVMRTKADGTPEYSYEVEVWDLGEALQGRGIDGGPDAAPLGAGAPVAVPGR